jgi:hypothetical protein
LQEKGKLDSVLKFFGVTRSKPDPLGLYKPVLFSICSIDWSKIDNLLKEAPASTEVLAMVSHCKKQSVIMLAAVDAEDWEYGGLLNDPEILEYMKTPEFEKLKDERRREIIVN